MPDIYLSSPHMGDAERDLLLDAFDSNWVAPLGPHVDAFEIELAARVGVGHVAALSSGTGALHLALVILGIGHGDLVLVPTLTFSATANAVRYVGARPVFVDADPGTWQVDPNMLAEAVEQAVDAGRAPAAVITVDLYGQCADHDPIAAVCEQYEIPIIEDAAEGLGATYRGRPAGSLGDMGVLSFNGNKIITTGGGGALVSDREDYVRQARFLATQARDPAPHYEHSTIGYNYRLSNLLAAVGRGQLKALDDRVASRRANNAFYREALGDLEGIEFMPEAAYGTATFWLTTATIDPSRFGATRDDVIAALAAEEIEARPVWKPMHLQPVFRGCEVVGGGVARHLFETGVCLPSGSDLTRSQLGLVAGIVQDCARP